MCAYIDPPNHPNCSAVLWQSHGASGISNTVLATGQLRSNDLLVLIHREVLYEILHETRREIPRDTAFRCLSTYLLLTVG